MHEHRLVYRVTGTGEMQTLEVVACRFHYWRDGRNGAESDMLT